MGINIDATRTFNRFRALNLRRSGFARGLCSLATSPSSLPSWLRQLACAAQPWLDQSLGIVAWAGLDEPSGSLQALVELDALGHEQPEETPARRVAEAIIEHVSALPESDVLLIAESDLPFAARRPRAAHDDPFGSRIAGYVVIRIASHWAEGGLRVFLIVPSTHACLLDRWQRKTVSALIAQLRVALSLRLFAHSGQAAASPTDGECMFVRLRESAHCQQLCPDRARQLWQELLDGNWAVLVQQEVDGRCFVLARRDDARTRLPLSLTDRESRAAALAVRGHSNKYIAYELGVSISTGYTLVSSAIEKLGLRSRVELVELFGALSAQDSSKLSSSWAIRADCFAADCSSYALFEITVRRLEPPGGLTRAERDVVLGVLRRKSNAEIARARRTSKNTVANQLRAIYVKLGISGRSQLISSC